MTTPTGGSDRQQFARGIQKLRTLAQQAAAKNGAPLIQAAIVLEGAIKEELSKPGSGRVYRRAGKRGNLFKASRDRIRGVQGPISRRAASQLHQASAPGEPPAPDTGTLRASIGYEATANGLRVGTSLAYAAALEFGTVYATTSGFKRLSVVQASVQRGGRLVTILPRPFMRPAVAKVRGEMTQVVVGELRALTKAVMAA